MGGRRTMAARPEGLSPASALTVAEAASLAGVEQGEIEARIADGSLLSERRGGRGRTRVVVRLFDLADVYPAVMGRPEPATSTGGDGGDGREPDGTDDPDAELEADPAPDPAPDPAKGAESGGGGDPAQGAGEDPGDADLDLERLVPRPGSPGRLAEDTSVRSAPRAALIQLCDDLETRLDLAERERQASTASLLMAQRRVLDLEADARRAPWRSALVGAALLLSIGALVVAARAPARAAEAVREEVAPLSAALSTELESVRSDAAARAASLESAIADLGRAARAAGEEDGARIDALAETLSAELERSRVAARRAEDAVAAALAEDAGKRAAALAALRAEDAAVRARMEERLDEAEAVLGEARASLARERDGRAADARAAAESTAALAAVIERLESEVRADRAAIDALRDQVEASQRAAAEERARRAAPADVDDPGSGAAAPSSTEAGSGALSRLIEAWRGLTGSDRRAEKTDAVAEPGAAPDGAP